MFYLLFIFFICFLHEARYLPRENISAVLDPSRETTDIEMNSMCLMCLMCLMCGLFLNHLHFTSARLFNPQKL